MTKKMKTIKFRKNELKFYLGCLPKEITRHLKESPDDKLYVEEFLSKYTYNFVTKKWVRPRGKNLIDRLRENL